MSANDRIPKPPHFLLLRGLARHQKHWSGFDALLASELDVDVHHLDLPGFGTEHERPPPLTVPETMADVRERWLALKEAHEGPWGLMAISLGGMIAMAWSDAHPQDFAGQVIMNSSAKNLGKPWERMGTGALSYVLRAMATGSALKREQYILAATSIRADEHEAMAEASAALDSFAPMSVKHAIRQLTAAARFDAPSRFETPTLLLAAEQDELAHRICSERLAERTGAALEVCPRSGHDLPRDAPDWIIERVRAWLAD